MRLTKNHRITMVLPVYGRPERTKRMLQCIRNQTVRNWQLFLVGDGCPDFQKMINEPWFTEWVEMERWLGNEIVYFNASFHKGDCGYSIINYAIRSATGKYFIFGGNDDIIDNNHFEHYLAGIENTEYDFCYYNTWLDPEKKIRYANLNYGGIGHSELIIRTDFLKMMPEHDDKYGHDWRLVQWMMAETSKYMKAFDEPPTYRVMSIRGKTNDTID